MISEGEAFNLKITIPTVKPVGGRIICYGYLLLLNRLVHLKKKDGIIDYIEILKQYLMISAKKVKTLFRLGLSE